MPEYLAPGVYVEETSFRTKTIEGVSTSTAAFVGPTRYGPTWGFPELLTSLADFERIYGSIDPLSFEDAGTLVNFTGQAVRSFFNNGGSRLYVSRIYKTGDTAGFAVRTQTGGSPPNTITWRARFPGNAGNLVLTVGIAAQANTLSTTAAGPVFRGASRYDVVWISPVSSPPGSGGRFYWAQDYLNTTTGKVSWRFHDVSGGTKDLTDVATQEIRVFKATVQVAYPDTNPRSDVFDGLAFDPRHPRSLSTILALDPATRQQALTLPVAFQFSGTGPEAGIAIADLLVQLSGVSITGIIANQPAQIQVQMANGSDGNRPTFSDYEGIEDPSNPLIKTGLVQLQDVEDVSIVAAPGSTFGGEGTYRTDAQAITNSLIAHAERMRYRIAVLDSPDQETVSQANAWRGLIDSSYAALYYPWVRILDPVTGAEINAPPSGFVAGIYARNDVNIGVHKAPANEVVTDAIGFEVMLNKAQQDVLNPNGVNAFRFFEGRGYRLWGARTATSDAEWKYVNLRRYINYLKRSIDLGTQFIVFENNGPDLWAKTTQLISDFLYSEFRSGRLFGVTKDQAFFVRCDLTTMTQNDLDNGRLVCLIGVALLRPAEFVIFRIGQFTAITQP